MKYNRHKSRQFAIQILYSIDQNKLTLSEAINQVFDNFEPSNDSIEFVNYVMLHIDEIDKLIVNNLENYKITRLNPVDRAILRLATSEMINNKNPDGIIINEALDLTHEFSDSGNQKSVHFNNKVLDNILKSIRK